ncbi:MAG: MFS transporter [bacterium]
MLFSSCFFFVVLAFANLETTFVLMTERHFGYLAFENSLIFMFIGAIVGLVNGVLIGPLVKKFGESKLLILGIIIQAIAFLVLPYTNALWTLLIATGSVALGSGLTNPTLQSLISRNTGKDEQGGVLGVTQSLGSLARVFGPAWGGWFFDHFGVPAPYWSGGLLLLGCAVLSFYATSRIQHNQMNQEKPAAMEI